MKPKPRHEDFTSKSSSWTDIVQGTPSEDDSDYEQKMIDYVRSNKKAIKSVMKTKRAEERKERDMNLQVEKKGEHGKERWPVIDSISHIKRQWKRERHSPERVKKRRLHLQLLKEKAASNEREETREDMSNTLSSISKISSVSACLVTPVDQQLDKIQQDNLDDH